MTDNRKINIKALVVGVLTDLGSSIVLGIILGVVAAIILIAQGVPPKEVAVRLQGQMLLIPSMIIGLGGTLLGGFVAGRIAKDYEVFHGGIVGCISILLGFFFWSSCPLWYNLAGLIVTIPCGMLGGNIAKITRKNINKNV
ncbi:MAG: hypothetical protein WC317_07810 [Candidatus Omnitrophota bacterium]|jgi:hypothetical protein